jgi:hypothetical protein
MVIKYISAVVIGIALMLLWHYREVDIRIVGVTLAVPARTIVAMSGKNDRSDLDKTEGAMLALPDGPYFGEWGILLQSSHERHADGMPPVLRESLRRSDLQLKKTSFGWLECGAICGRETWYFQRQPLFNESRYAVVSVTCQETNICKLAFSYKDMDVEVTLDRASIADVPQILQAAQLQIKQLEVGR